MIIMSCLPQLQIEKEAVDFCYDTDLISSKLHFVVTRAKEKKKNIITDFIETHGQIEPTGVDPSTNFSNGGMIPACMT